MSTWEGDGLVVAVAGVGKVSAAIAAQYVCDVFKPRCMIAIGLAGGLEDDVHPGQVIVGTGAVQHDLDGRPLTEARGIIPGLGLSVIPADPAVAEKLLIAARLESKHARPGLVLTGDQDNTIPNALSMEMASGIPGAKLVVLPNCGHMPQPEQTQATAEALTEWLRN